jgi:hypothetical protein
VVTFEGVRVMKTSRGLSDRLDGSRDKPAPLCPAEDFLGFGQHASKSDEGTQILDLVSLAAEMLKGLERRADESDTRAQALVSRALERLQAALNHIDFLESARLAAAKDADRKLREAGEALRGADSRIADLETQLAAAHLRVRAAEVKASRAEDTLVRIEGAIRTQLLGAKQESRPQLAVAA